MPEDLPTLGAGAQAVPHVVHEDAVLDEHVALRRTTFVVDGEAAPLAAHRAVVDERHERRRHLLAEATGEHRCTLADEVGLEPVPTRLVEHHAATAGADDHGHLTRGSRSGEQLGDGPLCRGAGDVLDVVGVEQLEADGAADGLATGLHAGVAGGDRARARTAS